MPSCRSLARAGKTGKGFLLVAAEVKNLTNQTDSATEEIRVQVTEIQEATNNAVVAIDQISKTITKVEHISGTIEEAVGQQGDATDEIARSIQDVVVAARSLTEPVQHVNEETETTAGLTKDVRQTIAQITDEVRDLKTSVMAVVRESMSSNHGNGEQNRDESAETFDETTADNDHVSDRIEESAVASA